MPATSKPLTWQKLRALLADKGVFTYAWRVGTKKDARNIVVFWDGPGKPGKRAWTKLLATLDALGIKYGAHAEASIAVKAQTIKA